MKTKIKDRNDLKSILIEKDIFYRKIYDEKDQYEFLILDPYINNNKINYNAFEFRMSKSEMFVSVNIYQIDTLGKDYTFITKYDQDNKNEFIESYNDVYQYALGVFNRKIEYDDYCKRLDSHCII